MEYRIKSIDESRVIVETFVHNVKIEHHFNVNGPITTEKLEEFVGTALKTVNTNAPNFSPFPQFENNLFKTPRNSNPFSFMLGNAPLFGSKHDIFPDLEEELAEIFSDVPHNPDLAAARFLDWMHNYLYERERDEN